MGKYEALARSYRSLPMVVWVLFVTETIVATGSFVYPFLAIVLTRNFGMDEAHVGMLFAVSAIACLVGIAIGGVLADAIPRKSALLATMLVSALGYAAVPLTSDVRAVACLIVLSLGAMSATKPAFNSLVADFTGCEQRKAAFSLLYAAVNVGFAMGPIVASALLARDAKWLFLGDASATLLGAAIIFLFVPSAHASAPRSEIQSVLRRAVRGVTDLWEVVHAQPALLGVLALYCVNIGLFAQAFFALPLFVTRHWAERGTTLYGLIMTANAVAVVVLTPVITVVTRRLSSGTCLVLGSLLFAVGFGGYALARSLVAVGGLVIVWTLGELMTKTNAQVYVASRAPTEQMGRMNALLEFAHEIGFGIGPAAAGICIAHGGVDAVWLYVAGVGISAGLVMAGLKRLRIRAPGLTSWRPPHP